MRTPSNIENILKEFDRDFDCINGLPYGYSNWDNYFSALRNFVSINLEFIRKEGITVGREIQIDQERERQKIDMIAEDLRQQTEERLEKINCFRCNDNGCPACDTKNRGSKYNPSPY